MSMVNRKSFPGIGRRTRLNVLEGKTIRKHKDGGDVFEDYWTDSDEENDEDNHSCKSSHFFSLSVNSQNALSNEEMSDFSNTDQTVAMSELVSGTPKSEAKISKSGAKISLPVSSSKSFHKNRMSSISFKHSSKCVVRNLDKEIFQDTLQQNSPVSNNKKDELVRSSVSTPNKYSETLRSLEKTHVKTKNTLETEKILSNYDKYDALIMQMMCENNDGDNYPQHPAQNTSSLSEHSVLKLNGSNLSVADNIDDKQDNFDQPAVIGARNKKAKSDGIKSLEKKNSPGNVSKSRNKKASSLPSAQNTSSLSQRSVLKLNDSNLTNNLSVVDSIDDKQDNFDQPAVIGARNKKAKSDGIKSLEKKNSPRNVSKSRDKKASNLPSRISPDKTHSIIKEVQTKLNASLKSLNRSNKMENKENSQRVVHVSNSEKETSDYVTVNKIDSSAVKSPLKVNSSNLFENSDAGNSVQMDKPSRKIETKNNREASRDMSSHVHSNEYDSSIQENQNKSNSSLKSPEKRKHNNEKCSLGSDIKNTAISSIENKKQKIAVDEMSSIPENELNTSDCELHINDIASEQDLLSDTSGSSSAKESSIDDKRNTGDEKDDKHTPRKENSDNLSPEQEHLHINSNADALSSQSRNLRSRGKPTELKDTEKKINDGKQRGKFELNSSNHHGKQASVKDLSVEREQIASISDDNYSSPRSKRKQPLESSKIKVQSPSRKNKQKSISAKLSNHDLHQLSVDDLSAVQELPLNNSFDNPHSPKKNVSKKKHSSAKSYNKEQVRRSSRQRYAPFAQWRNERLLYRFEKGEIKILGIDEGIKDDDASIQHIYTKRKYRMKKKEKISGIKKIKLFDPKLKKQVSTNVHKAFQSTPWFDRHNENGNSAYRIKRLFETTNSAFGFLEIDGFEKKPMQHMPDEDLQLTVIEGEVDVVIQENCFKSQKKDMFMIPRGIPYSIININKRKALLAFSVGKFKVLEKGLVD